MTCGSIEGAGGKCGVENARRFYGTYVVEFAMAVKGKYGALAVASGIPCGLFCDFSREGGRTCPFPVTCPFLWVEHCGVGTCYQTSVGDSQELLCAERSWYACFRNEGHVFVYRFKKCLRESGGRVSLKDRTLVRTFNGAIRCAKKRGGGVYAMFLRNNII